MSLLAQDVRHKKPASIGGSNLGVSVPCWLQSAVGAASGPRTWSLWGQDSVSLEVVSKVRFSLGLKLILKLIH